jgi:hypothetical protein
MPEYRKNMSPCARIWRKPTQDKETKLVPRIWAAPLVSDPKLKKMPNCY